MWSMILYVANYIYKFLLEAPSRAHFWATILISLISIWGRFDTKAPPHPRKCQRGKVSILSLSGLSLSTTKEGTLRCPLFGNTPRLFYFGFIALEPYYRNGPRGTGEADGPILIFCISRKGNMVYGKKNHSQREWFFLFIA